MKLSEHFTLEEAMFSAAACRLGIDNTPPPEVLYKFQEMARQLLEPLRARVGPIIVSSWWRCPELNAATPGSSPTSQHAKAEAADIWTPNTPLLETFKIAWRTLPFDQLIWEYGRWIHLSYSPEGRPRGNVLRIFRGAHGPETIRVSADDFDSLAIESARG